MKSTTGVLTLVQEERFQLRDANERCRLFVLAHDAPLEGSQLQVLKATGARVSVEYDDVPGVIVHVAHRVDALGASA